MADSVLITLVNIAMYHRLATVDAFELARGAVRGEVDVFKD